jgi:uncharacterized protein (TIGR02996 family)
MTHAEAFLRDILAHPDDDAPRLIFADWLEEQGDANSVARAEFIRVQCALSARHVLQQRRVELERREQQILAEWGEEWGRPILRLNMETWKFHRGFIDEVAVDAHTFLAHANRLFRRAPIQHLHLVPGASIPMAALVDNAQLRRLRSLALCWNGLESRDMHILVVSQHLTNLTALDLSHNRIGDSGIRALAESRVLRRLERLSLRGNDIGAGGLRALAQALESLARSPDGLRLRRLVLSIDNLSAAGRRVIAESSVLWRLVRV